MLYAYVFFIAYSKIICAFGNEFEWQIEKDGEREREQQNIQAKNWVSRLLANICFLFFVIFSCS